MKPLTYTLSTAGICCRTCQRGPYRSTLAALPHALRCRLSPLKRLGWWAGCRVGYPACRGCGRRLQFGRHSIWCPNRRNLRTRFMAWAASHFDPYEGP